MCSHRRRHCCCCSASTYHQFGPGDGGFFLHRRLIGRFCRAGDGGGGEGEHHRGPHPDQPSTFVFLFLCNVLLRCERPPGALGCFLRSGGTMSCLGGQQVTPVLHLHCCFMLLFYKQTLLGYYIPTLRMNGQIIQFFWQTFWKKELFFSTPPTPPFNIL